MRSTWWPWSSFSSVLCSLPRIRLCLRTPKIWAILSAVRRNNPNSQERSKILWIGKFRRKRKFRQYSTWFSEYSRRRGMAARSFLENFGPSTQGPVIQAFTDDLRAEAIGGCLERFHVGDPQKGVIVFAEANTLALEFPGDE